MLARRNVPLHSNYVVSYFCGLQGVMNTFIWDPEQQPGQNYGSLMEKTRVGAAVKRNLVSVAEHQIDCQLCIHSTYC